MNPRKGEEPVLPELLAGLREGGPDLADEPAKARAALEETLANIPVAEDLSFSSETLGGVPVVKGSYPGAAADGVLLYFHGGGFVSGSAHGYRALAAELARAAGLSCVSVEYRLAPEHPFPAGIEDCCAAYRGLLEQGIAPERIAVAGDSAGGGLLLSVLLSLRDAGDPLPAAAVALSPWVDMTCSGESFTTKAAQDPMLTHKGLSVCAGRYLGDHDPRDPIASPVFADLSGLPPLLIQVGSIEVLLSDSIRLAGAAGAAGVAVRLDIWPGMPHDFPAFNFMLEAGRLAIADAGWFVEQALG